MNIPRTPGSTLNARYLQQHSISQYRLAKDIHVSARRINEIVKGERSITADTALRFSKYFGNSAEYWLKLQSDYDLKIAKAALKNDLAAILTIAA